MTPREIPTPELLLGHLGWLRELARRLVADRELAEDLAQDACLVALQRGPRDPARPRPWLAGVLRNLLRQRLRGEGRRTDRERASARGAEAESTERTVERIHLQRELARHVLDLDEPYRTAVLLRFFEELPPREIARRLGVPTTTVQSRLTRGLARLRERLDREDGFARPGWAALLVPLGHRQGSLPWVTAGGLLMNVKLLVAAAVAVATGAALALAPRTTSAPRVAALRERPLEDTEGLRLESTPDEPRRLEVERPAGLLPDPEAPSALAARPVQRVLVRGRVLDVDARPRPAIPLRARSGAGAAEDLTTDAAGGFELSTTAPRLTFDVVSEPWVTVRAGDWQQGARLEPVVVVARSTDYGGQVIDELGRPLPEAQVRLELPLDLPMRLAEVLDASRVRTWATRSERTGAFRLGRVPVLEGARLVCVLDGYEPLAVPAPLHADDGLLLELPRPATPLEGALRGRVVHADGRPAPEARVAIGLASCVADPEGFFELDLSLAVTAGELVAVAAGALPARVARPEPPDERGTGWPDFVEVRLGGPALTLRGLVVDHEGRPRPDALVWIEDPTRFGMIGRLPASLEGLMAGSPVPPRAQRLSLPERDGDDYTDQVAPAASFGPSPLWNPVRTDGEGRFELPGVLDRPYRLTVAREGSTMLLTSEAVRPGPGEVLVRLPAPDVTTVRGRVVLEDGTPMADVALVEWVPVVDVVARLYGGTHRTVLAQAGREVATDDEGRFELRDVPRHGVRLRAGSDRILPATFELDDFGDPRSLELVVEGRCHLQVLLDDPEGADSLALRDEDGNELDVMVLAGGSVEAYSSVPVIDGRSEVVSVSSRARELLLLEAGEVVGRSEIRPRPGERTVVRR